eukprot:gene4160-4714_t
MKILCLVIIFSTSVVKINAKFGADEIEKFNIGQLFAFYNMAVCKKPSQFAVAKKDGSGECQWKISADFLVTPAPTKDDLPIEDKNGNCVFACLGTSSSKALHTEKVINRFLKGKAGEKRSEYNLYTYLAPCKYCDGTEPVPDNTGETAELDEFKGVYYTEKPNDINFADVSKGSQVINEILQTTTSKGLNAIKKNTEVDLDSVKTTIREGKAANESKDTIINEASGSKYLKSAIKSYLDQN